MMGVLQKQLIVTALLVTSRNLAYSHEELHPIFHLLKNSY